MRRMRGVQVVVTGAGGFIGRWLVRELHRRGARVTAVVRSPLAAGGLFSPEVALQFADITLPETLDRAFAGAEVVFHAAGLYRFGLGHRRALMETNLHGTQHVLRAAAKAGVRCLVHLSSAGVLSRPSGLIREEDYPATRPRWCAYKASKWDAEQSVLAASREGLPVRIASITCPLGAEDTGPTPTGRMVRDYVDGRFLFSTRTGLNFVGVRDLARGLIAIAENGRNGQRYLLGQENLTLTEFLGRLARLSEGTAPRLEIPWPLIAAGGLLGESAHFWRPRESRRLCLETALQARRHQFFDVAPAQEALGWSPQQPLDEALRESLAWFRDGSPAMDHLSPTTEPHVA